MSAVAGTQLAVAVGTAAAVGAAHAAAGSAVRATQEPASRRFVPGEGLIRRHENARPLYRTDDGATDWPMLALPAAAAVTTLGIAAANRRPHAALGAGLFAGGVLANVGEYAARRSVTDYVRLPGDIAFNVGDAAAGVGALTLLYALRKGWR